MNFEVSCRQSEGISTMRGGISTPEWVFCCIFTVFVEDRAEEFLQCAEEFSHQNGFSAAFDNICRRQSGGISTMPGEISTPEWVLGCIFKVFVEDRAEEFLQCAKELSHQNGFSAAFDNIC